ncbi:MAG: 50S ribosomal protein L15 [Bacteroidales bacterium]|nr:50S ribosomal protein L15 [Bacteroidales bacterium]
MDLSKLKPAKGSVKTSKRIGRGEGSGRGGTSTRGHKGAQSRSGYSRKGGFEGGQMPLVRRLPKFGFKNPNRVEYAGVNIDVIQKLAEEKGLEVIDINVMIENGLVSKKDRVKVLGRGTLTAKVEVTAHAFTATAVKAIEANGGKVNTI